MAERLRRDRSRRPPTAPVRPPARHLAALGTVLCLYRPQYGNELGGWAQAVRVEARMGLQSDGLRESLVFFDHEGRGCWQLWLLPDSDFLAWDRLAALLPGGNACQASAGVGERLWQRLARRLTGDHWRACALRLHALPQPLAGPLLAASLAPLSALGLSIARDIARGEGADTEHLADGGGASWPVPVAQGAVIAYGGNSIPLRARQKRAPA